MGWEDYGSEGFSHPPPELFGFNQVRDAVFVYIPAKDQSERACD